MIPIEVIGFMAEARRHRDRVDNLECARDVLCLRQRVTSPPGTPKDEAGTPIGDPALRFILTCIRREITAQNNLILLRIAKSLRTKDNG